jgi:subtilisin family serine protease/Mg-chelatase subunit ChlD
MMRKKVMIHFGESEKVRLAELKKKVAKILAEYPNSLLARADEEQIQLLESQGFKIEILENDREIKIGGYRFTTDKKLEKPTGVPSVLSLSIEGIGDKEKNYFVVQFIGPIKREWKTEVEKLGGKIYNSVPNYALIIGMDLSTKKKVENLDFVQWIGVYQPAYKINSRFRKIAPMMKPSSSGLTEKTPKEEKRQVGGNIEIDLFELEGISNISQEIEQAGGKVLTKVKNRIIVDMDISQIQEIAKYPVVKSIKPHALPVLHNDVASGIMESVPETDVQDLDGDDQIVAIADSGLDTGVNDATMLDDFEGRILNIYSWPVNANWDSDIDNGGADDGASDLNGHGTHVAGSAVGNGAKSNGNIRGIAPAAKLIFQAFEQLTHYTNGHEERTLCGLPDDLNDLYQQAYNDGARIHSNSWGIDDPALLGSYWAFSEDTDEFMWHNREFLILRSAGNGGPGADTIGPPGTAKNCLTVGASETERLNLPNTVNFPASPSFPSGATWNPPGPLGLGDGRNNIADLSSRGPTDDGRIKPDVIAPGTWILSTRSSLCVADTGPDGLGPPFNPPTGDEDGNETHPEAVWLGLPGEPIFGTGDQDTPDAPPNSGPDYTDNYMYSLGTSMSTPLVAGAAALIRQYLMERRNHTPSAALLKAIIINGAVDVGMGVPNNDQGWGRVSTRNAIFPQPQERVQFADETDYAVETGEDREFHVWVSDNTQPFQATLVWTDYPGENLQNKLYLRVIDPNSVTHDGDVSAYPNPENNVQKVIIDNPPLGEYQIIVHGTEVIQGIPDFPTTDKQDFALVVSNGLGYSKNPIDVAQVIDRSGSMGYYDYMEPAKERAKQFIDIMQINDKASCAAFNVLPPNPYAESIVDLTPLTSFDDKLAARDLINTIEADGRTSIGAGLEVARDQLSVNDGKPHAIILLSDGFENEPPWVFGPPDWYTGSDTTTIMPTIPVDTVIYTIGLGVTTDHQLLEDIALARSGVYYQILDDNELWKLHEIYYDIQALAAGIDIVGLNSSQVGIGQQEEQEVDVDSSSEEVLFALSWVKKAVDVDFYLVDPKGKLIKPTSKGVRFMKGSSYKFYRVSKPLPGSWKMRINNRRYQENPEAVHYTTSVMSDTEVKISPVVKVEEKDNRLLILVKLIQGKKRLDRVKLFADITYMPLSIKDLIKKHNKELEKVTIDLKKLKGDKVDDVNLFKLRHLNRDYWKKNGKGLISFTTQSLQLKEAEKQEYVGQINLDDIRGGFVTVKIRAQGTTEGTKFARQRMIPIASVKEQPLKRYKVKVHLDKVKILDDHDIFWWNKGEIYFKSTTTPGDDPKRANVLRLPKQGIYKISDRQGKNIRQINECIFDGEVYSNEDLNIKIEGREKDWIIPDDYFETYRRKFTGNPSSWAGVHKPFDEPRDKEALKDWQVWYKIEVTEVQ